MKAVCFQVGFHPTSSTWRGTDSAAMFGWEDVRNYSALLLEPFQTEHKANSFCGNFVFDSLSFLLSINLSLKSPNCKQVESSVSWFLECLKCKGLPLTWFRVPATVGITTDLHKAKWTLELSFGNWVGKCLNESSSYWIRSSKVILPMLTS